MESLLPQPLLVVGDTVDQVSSRPGRHHSWSPLLLCLQVPPRSREGGQQEHCFFEALRLAGCPPQHPSRLWIPVESGTWLALALAYPTPHLALGLVHLLSLPGARGCVDAPVLSVGPAPSSVLILSGRSKRVKMIPMASLLSVGF